jgi:hypothetical protein
MALTSFAAVQQFLNDFVQNNQITIGSADHAAFWNTTYDDFINGNVPTVQDPNTGNPVPILNKINGKYDGPTSNIVTVLAGTNASFPQMPKGGPYMSSDQIQEISDWISAQCPK